MSWAVLLNEGRSCRDAAGRAGDRSPVGAGVGVQSTLTILQTKWWPSAAAQRMGLSSSAWGRGTRRLRYPASSLAGDRRYLAESRGACLRDR